MTATLQPQTKASGNWAGYGLLILTAACAAGMFARWASGLWAAMWSGVDPHYSYAPLIPVISGYLLWRKRDEFRDIHLAPDGRGLLLAGVALLLFIPGTFADMITLSGLSLLVMVLAAVWSFYGLRALRLALFPILYLIFMMPISNALFEPIEVSLRLLSTHCAAAWLNLFGEHAMTQGTSLILPTVRLDVPDACSGMQSLLALTAALTAVAYLACGRLGRRLSLLAAIPPVLIVCNGLRIAVIAMIARLFGLNAAEGPLHGSSGLVVFMLGFGLIFAGAHILGLELTENSAPRPPAEAAGGNVRKSPWLPHVSLVTVALVTLLLLGNWFRATLPATANTRETPLVNFSNVSMQVGSWTGKHVQFDAKTVEQIGANSLLSREYHDTRGHQATLLVEFRPEASRALFHTPNLCMSVAGWTVDVPERKTLRAGNLIVPFTSMQATQSGHRRLFAYWFRYNGVYAAPDSLLERRLEWGGMLGRIIGCRQTQTLFEINSPVTGSVAETYQAQADLLARLVPSIEEALAAADKRAAQ